MILIVFAVAGLIVGHILRRLTPVMLGMEDRTLPFRVPWLEVLSGLIFLLTAYQLGNGPGQWRWFFFCSLLLAITSTDTWKHLIPGMLCYVGAVVGIALSAIYPDAILDLQNQERLLSFFGVPLHRAHLGGGVLALTGLAIGFLQMEFIRRVFNRLLDVESMGFGDSLLMMMIGAYIGPIMVFYALFAGCFIGVCIGGIWKVVFKSSLFPFGPSLALGSWGMLLYAPWLLRLHHSFYEFIFNLPPIVSLLFSLMLMILLVVLILRLKRKAADYQQMVDDTYGEDEHKSS